MLDLDDSRSGRVAYSDLEASGYRVVACLVVFPSGLPLVKVPKLGATAYIQSVS
jgi:hypothetical protein